MKLIDNYIYFYHLEKFFVLPTYPETLGDNMQTTFTSQNALSRTAPVFSYIQSGPRTMQISLGLHRDMMRDVNVNVSNLKPDVSNVLKREDYVDILVRYLQAAAVPKYNIYSANDKNVVPPMVAIRFGNDVFIKGVISSGVNVSRKKPIMIDGKYACLDVSFTVSETDPYDAESIAKYGSFRGCTGGLRAGIYNTNSEDIKYGGEFGGEYVTEYSNTANVDITEGLLLSKMIAMKDAVDLAMSDRGNGPYTQSIQYENWKPVSSPEINPEKSYNNIFM